jgi:glycosyltransferase involved in cell wall biosynthesis
MTQKLRFSLVIPVKDEAESLPALVDEIAAILSGEPFEIVLVDDGSTDATPAVLRELAHWHSLIRTCTHEHCCGKSAAILTGVRAARAELIATLDGDGQNDPRYLPPLLRLATEPKVGLAAGQRRKHAHSWVKKIGSRLANRLRSSLLKDNTIDTACGLKAFRKEVFLRLPYFDNMHHRFLPALVMREGLEVRHLDVTDRQRRHGASKYGRHRPGAGGRARPDRRMVVDPAAPACPAVEGDNIGFALTSGRSRRSKNIPACVSVFFLPRHPNGSGYTMPGWWVGLSRNLNIWF